MLNLVILCNFKRITWDLHILEGKFIELIININRDFLHTISYTGNITYVNTTKL